MGNSFTSRALVLSLFLMACAPTPAPEDATREVDPGCCPIGPLRFCGGTPTGGWAGDGCETVADLGATGIVDDAHGCPMLIHEGPCICLCPDAGPQGDAAVDQDAGSEEDAGL